MKRKLSPPHPAWGLLDVIPWASTLYNEFGDKDFALDEAVDVLGYTTAGSGQFHSKIGTMRQYGLLQSENKRYWLTSRLADLVNCPEHSFEYQEALYSSAQAPEIFREIIEQVPQGADEAIKFHLMAKKGFVERGADRVVNAFRDTLKHVDISKPNDVNNLNGGASAQVNKTDTRPDLGQRRDADGSEKADVIPIMLEGNRSVRVVLPLDMTTRDWERLIAVLTAHKL